MPRKAVKDGRISVNFYTLKQINEKKGNFDFEGSLIKSPESCYEIIHKVTQIHEEAVEKFGIITLTTKNEIAGFHIISIGSLSASIVHPREVFKAAMLNNASGIILFHNHPSGDPTPSCEDIETTKRLINAGDVLGIKVLDHIIIGDCKYTSLKEKGLI